ncbi:MAG: hypothetical protein H6509_08085 [Bryobacterales bacterium]|nr:hypothetical protein [Bryobacterales bacterium]
MKHSRFTAFLAVTTLLFLPIRLFSNVDGAEAGRTGGPFPGEASCASSQCHNNTTPNTEGGSVSILVNGAPIEQYEYSLGEVVDLVVRVADPAQGRWGFEVTARSAANGCQSEGSLAANDSNVSVRNEAVPPSCASVQYATHSFPKTGSGQQEFAMRWTAPSTDVGPIIFAAAGNAANGNNERNGDHIYTTSQEVQPKATTVEPAPTPQISAGGIVLANLVPTVASAAPNAIVSVFGQEFSATQTLAPALDSAGKVSTELGGVCVEIGGHRSPMFAVLPTQLNLQASDQVGLGPQSVVVIRDCDLPSESRSAPQMVDFADAAPGFFVFTEFLGQDGKNPIAALKNSDFSLVAPINLFPTGAPAAPGDIVSLFATGLGVTRDSDNNPLVMAGEIPNRTVSITRNATVSIGGVTLPSGDVFYVGVAPCCAGLYQVVVKVPETLPAGQHEVVLHVDGWQSPAGPFLPVE